MKHEPFWVAATVYNQPPVKALGDPQPRSVFAPGAFSWNGSEPWPSTHKGPQPQPEMVALPRPAPLYLDHAWLEDDAAPTIGQVLGWLDRPEALYAQVDLDDTALSWAAARAWNSLWHNPDSTVSVGAVLIEDDLGLVDERSIIGERDRRDRPIVRAAVHELSVMTSRGYLPQPRMLAPSETGRLLAGEPIELERVGLSIAAKIEMGLG